MQATIRKSNKRIVNRIAKHYNLIVKWHDRKSSDPTDTFDVEEWHDENFYGLKAFSRDLKQYCDRYKIHVDLKLVDEAVDRRYDHFIKKYKSTFDSLKSVQP